MTMTVPAQEFQIGQRVRRNKSEPFIIRVIVFTTDDRILYSAGRASSAYEAHNLTLAPERPPYVPSERLVVGRRVTIAQYQHEIYRCETDDEMAARHAAERAEYDRPRPADPVIYNARGESIGISGRTSQDGPGADDRQFCDYPICSTRGAGHPLACNCRTTTPKAAP